MRRIGITAPQAATIEQQLQDARAVAAGSAPQTWNQGYVNGMLTALALVLGFSPVELLRREPGELADTVAMNFRLLAEPEPVEVAG